MTNILENYFALNIKLLKKDLRKARRKKSTEGYLNILNGGKPAILDYRLEYDSEKTYLVVNFGIEPQRIELVELELTFGTRNYFVCQCGSRANALYLKNGILACWKCHKLCYQSTTINRNSKHGRFLYQQHRMIKLMNEREKMARIFYRSRYTKHFTHWLEQCSKAGLVDQVKDAEKLMMAINSQ